MSDPHDPSHLVLVFLMSPTRGAPGDYVDPSIRRQHRALKKWRLPMSFVHALDDMPLLVNDRDFFNMPGCIHAIAVTRVFGTVAHPSMLGGCDVKISLRDYYFRVRHCGLHALLWSEIVEVYLQWLRVKVRLIT